MGCRELFQIQSTQRPDIQCIHQLRLPFQSFARTAKRLLRLVDRIVHPRQTHPHLLVPRVIFQIIFQLLDGFRIFLLFLQLDCLVIFQRPSLSHHAHRQPVNIDRVQETLFHGEKTIFQLETIDIHVVEYHVIPLLTELIVIPAIHDGDIRVLPKIMLQVRAMVCHDP